MVVFTCFDAMIWLLITVSHSGLFPVFICCLSVFEIKKWREKSQFFFVSWWPCALSSSLSMLPLLTKSRLLLLVRSHGCVLHCNHRNNQRCSFRNSCQVLQSFHQSLLRPDNCFLLEATQSLLMDCQTRQMRTSLANEFPDNSMLHKCLTMEYM